MKGKILMRNFTEEDIAEINKLYEKNYRIQRSPKVWNWEYGMFVADKAILAVAIDNEKIIGTQGMIPTYINIGGKVVLSGKSESSLLDPNYRGGTVFSDLYDFAMKDCKKKGMKCVWGFTSAVRVWRKKLGFLVDTNIMRKTILVTNLHGAVKIVIYHKTNSHPFRKIVESIVMVGLFTISQLQKSIYKHPMSKGNFKITTSLLNPNDVLNFWATLRVKYSEIITIHQDASFINWRINRNPVTKHQTYYLYRNNKLVSYCYVSFRKEFGRVVGADIVDFAFLDDNTGGLLLSTVLHRIKKQKVPVIHFNASIKNSLMISVFHLLKKHGFIRRKGSIPFVLKNISWAEKKELFKTENWYLNGIWFEGT